MSPSAKPLLVFQHVPWEGPHRLIDPFDGVVPVEIRHVLTDDTPLPAPSEVRGAIVMGGPMSVNDTEQYPRVAEEIAWLAEAIDQGVPLLGICLGSQLIAKAAGATVGPGPAPEIGWSSLEILDATDPLMATLAPQVDVLHWHGEIFTLPEGAVPLARSGPTPLQAFRVGDRAWGVLCHPEVDGRLTELWINEPEMAAEAEQVLGEDWAAQLRAGAAAASAGPGAAFAAAFASVVGTD